VPSPGFLDFGTKCPEVEKAKGVLVVPFLRSYNGIVEDNNNFLRRFQAMRFVLKIFAAPFVLALSLAVGVLSFVFSLASWAFSILSLLFAVCALFSIFIEGDTAWGIQGLVIAFCVSPFGLPAVAEWLISKLDGLNYSLKCFITD
jgi:uncharacterized membrane protein